MLVLYHETYLGQSQGLSRYSHIMKERIQEERYCMILTASDGSQLSNMPLKIVRTTIRMIATWLVEQQPKVL